MLNTHEICSSTGQRCRIKMICFETWVGCGVMADIFVYSLKDGLVFFDTWLGPAQAKIVMVTCWHSHLLALTICRH